jgi:hypothetical protein
VVAGALTRPIQTSYRCEAFQQRREALTLLLLELVMPLFVLGGLTVVIAGTIASLLLFRSMETRPMLINGVAGTLLSYPICMLAPVPSIVAIQFNAVVVYPVWSVAAALVVALAWKLGAMLGHPTPSPAQREAERVQRARARAARYRD